MMVCKSFPSPNGLQVKGKSGHGGKTLAGATDLQFRVWQKISASTPSLTASLSELWEHRSVFLSSLRSKVNRRAFLSQTLHGECEKWHVSTFIRASRLLLVLHPLLSSSTGTLGVGVETAEGHMTGPTVATVKAILTQETRLERRRGSQRLHAGVRSA